MAPRATMDGFDALRGFLAQRAVPGVEVLAGDVYRRALDGRVVAVRWPAAAADDGACARPSRLPGAGSGPGSGPGGAAAAALAALIAGPDADVAAAAAHLRGHALLGPLVRAAPGLRVPGHPDGAELAVRAILGQQVSVGGARTLAGRLTASYGTPLDRPAGGVTHAFPAPAALAAIEPEDLPMPRSRGRALVGLAAAVRDGRLDLSPDADPAAVRAGLLELWGIGPWTADYVLMRAFRAPDVLLVGDLGVRHALRALGADTSAAALRRLAQEVSPWGSYATMQLWHTLGAA